MCSARAQLFYVKSLKAYETQELTTKHEGAGAFSFITS